MTDEKIEELLKRLDEAGADRRDRNTNAVVGRLLDGDSLAQEAAATIRWFQSELTQTVAANFEG